MTKFLNRYMRKFHRWLALPIAILIPVFFVLRLMPISGEIGQVLLKAQSVQQILILVLALTGAYLFILPYLTKWRRQRAQRTPTPPKEER